MPQADIKYSSDLEIESTQLLALIETVIKKHDSNSGACKGRGYKTSEFHHTHIFTTISMLSKPHRDEAFTKALIEDLEKSLKQHIHQPCHFSLLLNYTGEGYITNFHEV